MNGSPAVLCLGILVADVIGRPVDSYPAPGTLQHVQSITPHIGGCAANTGVGLQTLGVACGVAGKVGRDGFGALIKSELAQHGVSIAGVIEDEVAPTSATMVLVRSDAERTFLHSTGANAAYVFGDFDPTLLAGVKLLHIAGHGLMPRFDGAGCAAVLKLAREMGVTTCLDTAGSPNDLWLENLRLTLPYLDYFVPSLHEVKHFVAPQFQDDPAQIARYFLKAGVKVVALKMGERGSYVTDGEDSCFVPAIEVDAKDATGAGDAFAAGFLCGVLNGFDLQLCAQLGNAAGALCVTEVGTIAGYRSLGETLDFLKEKL